MFKIEKLKINKRKKELEEEFNRLKDQAKRLVDQHTQIQMRLTQIQGAWQELNRFDGEGNKRNLKQPLDHLPKKK